MPNQTRTFIFIGIKVALQSTLKVFTQDQFRKRDGRIESILHPWRKQITELTNYEFAFSNYENYNIVFTHPKAS